MGIQEKRHWSGLGWQGAAYSARRSWGRYPFGCGKGMSGCGGFCQNLRKYAGIGRKQ